MDTPTKKCPMCAETIQLEARLCRFCGARFEVRVIGYCTNCHELREADEKGLCKICGGKVIDQHIESELVREKAPSVQPLTVPPPSPVQTGLPPKKRSTAGCVIGILLAIAGISIIGAILLRSISTIPVAPPTRIPSRTRTPLPTNTLRPTRTPTPAPIEITFDNIGDFPARRWVILRGQLVMFSSTYCNHTCGMLLANPSDTSQKITIFVTLGESRQNTLPNQMRPLPDPYTKADIQVRLDDGTYAGIGSRIIVTGRICETTSGEPCISDIFKIEAWNQ